MNRILMLLLILLLVICSFHITNLPIENFKSDGIEWGYDPVKSYSEFDSHLTRPIVGPDPGKEEINNWQYNPENTQVDYKYYQQNNDVLYESSKDNNEIDGSQDNLTQQLAPITWGGVGKNTSPLDYPVPVDGEQQTRVPDSQSNSEEYIIPNASTDPQYSAPKTNYFW
tara:strand:+ start:40 stop:546 length:507 start_codon:yes stop_codon:yes gene_type:complete